MYGFIYKLASILLFYTNQTGVTFLLLKNSVWFLRVIKELWYISLE